MKHGGERTVYANRTCYLLTILLQEQNKDPTGTLFLTELGNLLRPAEEGGKD